MKERRVVLITGCSSGIGRETAKLLAARGYAVAATARRLEDLAGVDAATRLTLDVTSEESTREAVDAVLRAQGRIDVLVNNAGFAIPGAVEDSPEETMRSMFEVNVFGLLRLIRAVAPSMRKEGSGRIVNIGSIAGRWSMGVWGGYSATKAAVAAIGDAARQELKPFGVRVILVEPGPIRTRFHEKPEAFFRAASAAQPGAASAYADLYRQSEALNAAMRARNPGPETAALAVLKAIEAPKPKSRYLAGVPIGARLMLGLGDGPRDAWFESATKEAKA